MKNNRNGLISYGGFPRSGNHTLGRVLSLAFPQCEIRWLVHRISEIATAPNCAITIRNPLEAIGSWIEFRGETADEKADAYLDWFCRYFTQLDRCADRVVLLDLNALATDANLSAGLVSQRFSLGVCASIVRDDVDGWLALNATMHAPNATSLNKSRWFERIQASALYADAMHLYELALSHAQSSTV